MFDNDGPWKNDTIEEINLSGGEPSEYEEVEDENDLCDCDPQLSSEIHNTRSRRLFNSRQGRTSGGSVGKLATGQQ